MAQPAANQADFLGGGGTLPASNVKKPTPRPTTLDGLVYTDTGEYTPLYYARMAVTNKTPGWENWVDPTNQPTRTQIDSGEYKWDEKLGAWTTEDRGVTKVMAASQEEADRRAAAQTVPVFTVSKTPNGISKTSGAIQGAAGGALAGSAFGPAGIVGGAALGAVASMPATGRQLQLSAGNGSVTGPGVVQGTAAQAAQGNANLAASGRTTTPVGGWGTTPSAQAMQGAIQNPYAGQPVATYTPGAGTNGQSAMTAEANRIRAMSTDLAASGNARAQTYFDQAATAGTRAAPQMAMPSSANQQAVYDRAMGFQAQSGADRILAERADISGAQRLEAMQMDMQGINNLESWQPTNSQQGVNALNAYRPTYAAEALPGLENFRARETAEGIKQLDSYLPRNTLEGAANLDNYYSSEGAKAALALEQYRSSDQSNKAIYDLQRFESDRSGIDRLNAYADEAQGPSAAQAMLRAQSDADKRTALSIAKSGRSTPAGQAQAMRQAISEGAAIAGETRGQGAVLAAQETDAYKSRQLQALAQAGSLISNAEAQRLSAMQASGQLLNDQDQMKLQALNAYAQVQTTRDSQRLSALQASGQLKSNADTNILGARTAAGQMRVASDQMSLAGKQTAGQMRTNMDGQMLTATSNAASLQGQMDQQLLGAKSNAAQLRLGADQIRSSNLQSAGQIRLSGSEINQRGAIAASNADLQAQALNLQSLSLAGNISTEMRNQDINVLRSNLDASLQTMGLNDNQVRFFNQLGNDREVASNNLQMSGAALGLTAEQIGQAQSALNLQWEQFGFSQLTNAQQLQYQYDAMNQQNSQFQQNNQLAQQNAGIQQAQLTMNQQAQQYNQTRQTRNDIFNGIGSAFTAISSLFPTSQSNTASSIIAPVQGLGWGGPQTPPPGGTGTSYTV